MIGERIRLCSDLLWGIGANLCYNLNLTYWTELLTRLWKCFSSWWHRTILLTHNLDIALPLSQRVTVSVMSINNEMRTAEGEHLVVMSPQWYILGLCLNMQLCLIGQKPLEILASGCTCICSCSIFSSEDEHSYQNLVHTSAHKCYWQQRVRQKLTSNNTSMSRETMKRCTGENCEDPQICHCTPLNNKCFIGIINLYLKSSVLI